MSEINDRIQLVRNLYEGAEIKPVNNMRDFNQKLSLTIPGDPVSDGRPRENKKLQIFYNAKKEFLRRIFREIYRRDPILQKLCILTPHRIEVRCYSRPTSKEAKYLSIEEIESESIFSIANKDNDNVEKVNWDVLQDSEFMIILNDSHTVNNETFKYYSFNPRTEINVYFSTTFTSKLYEAKIINSMEYKLYLCSKKYTIDKNEMSGDELISYLGLKLIDIKTTAQKKVGHLLSNYSADVIDGLYKYFFFGNAKNPFVDKYIKRKNRGYKTEMVIQAVCSKGKIRDELRTHFTKDKIYQDMQKEIV